VQEKVFRQLIINPGSASTKFAVYENESCLFESKIDHPATDLQRFQRVADQQGYRLGLILDALAERGLAPDSLAAVVGRGGLLQPMESGVYLVNEKMKQDLIGAPREEHAANLGALLADEIASRAGIPAFIVDPVCTDEMDEVARISGLPELERFSLCHTLNMKAVARKVAAGLGRRLEDCNFVVAHLGSGITVSPFKKGRIVDCNSAIQDGPFSPVRCGGLPAMQLMRMCYSGSYSFQEMYDKLMKRGGMQAYLGTSDVQEAEKRVAEGDGRALLVLEAMAYQIAKEIGAMAAVLSGEVDRVIITGGIAYSQFITGRVIARVRFIAPVELAPGEEELQSLALGGLRVLRGEEQPKTYLG
jgi:butyrate kinase